jgi:hypothetical protein
MDVNFGALWSRKREREKYRHRRGIILKLIVKKQDWMV